METLIPNYFFKRNKSVAEELKFKGRLFCNGGEYLKAGEKPLEIEPDDKSLREVLGKH